jgi:hypothetical protein
VSTGVSAGGALSTLLGASGDSRICDDALKALRAADASDAIFAVSAYCPITDLEHADAVHEWTFGSLSAQGGAVDQTVSKALAAEFADYEKALSIKASDGSAISADTASAYLVSAFLEPAATTHLAALADADRTSYLSSNAWITWSMASANGGDVDSLMYWDAGHGANNDPAAFIAWVAKETGYTG